MSGRKVGNGRQPYAIALADRSLMALAGLWENWRSPAGEWVRSFAIVTTEPNELCAELHNRMPVVLGREAWATWLGEQPADPNKLRALLAPFPSAAMTCWPVSARVGSVKNNDPSLVVADRYRGLSVTRRHLRGSVGPTVLSPRRASPALDQRRVHRRRRRLASLFRL